MWSELLPRLVGGTLIDDDAPEWPTRIVGYRLEANYVAIVGEKFTMGGSRQYFGLTAFEKDGRTGFALHAYGFSGVVFPPEGFKDGETREAVDLSR